MSVALPPQITAASPAAPTALRNLDVALPPQITAASPCTGHCSTVLGDEVCRSCQRTFDEIIAWPTISDAQRIAINQRVALLTERK